MSSTQTAPTSSPATAPASSDAWSRWRVGILVVGDALSFLAFASAGRNSHGESLTLSQAALTAAPFALGWFLVSPWLGAFRRNTTTGAFRMFKRTELAWVCAYPLTLVLRVSFGYLGLAENHNLPLSFAIVILLVNAVFLGAWRTVFAFIERFLPISKRA